LKTREALPAKPVEALPPVLQAPQVDASLSDLLDQAMQGAPDLRPLEAALRKADPAELSRLLFARRDLHLVAAGTTTHGKLRDLLVGWYHERLSRLVEDSGKAAWLEKGQVELLKELPPALLIGVTAGLVNNLAPAAKTLLREILLGLSFNPNDGEAARTVSFCALLIDDADSHQLDLTRRRTEQAAAADTPETRAAAATALAALLPRLSVKPRARAFNRLLEMAQEDDQEAVRAAAARALHLRRGKLNPEEAIRLHEADLPPLSALNGSSQ
jgi:hypothetical protein